MKPYRTAPEETRPRGFGPCPHCLTRVLPTAEGTCPSCLGDIDAAPKTRAQRAKLRIAEDDWLPLSCCSCGADTNEAEKVMVSEGTPVWVAYLLVALGVLFCWLLALVMLLTQGGKRMLRGPVTLTLRMPRCSACRSEGTLLPEHANLATKEMTFVVSRTFSDAVEERRA